MLIHRRVVNGVEPVLVGLSELPGALQQPVFNIFDNACECFVSNLHKV